MSAFGNRNSNNRNRAQQRSELLKARILQVLKEAQDEGYGEGLSRLAVANTCGFFIRTKIFCAAYRELGNDKLIERSKAGVRITPLGMDHAMRISRQGGVLVESEENFDEETVKTGASGRKTYDNMVVAGFSDGGNDAKTNNHGTSCDAPLSALLSRMAVNN